ncbi:MAG: HAMP domain-containing sensor histidine kinase [Isosphaeraceae bacterium]
MLTRQNDEALTRLIDLGHLASGVGHHVINAFSAIVSNAELLRLDPPLPNLPDPSVLAESIIRTALEASTVARRLIDYTRPVTSIEPDRAAFPPDAIRLEEIAADVVETLRDSNPHTVVWETDLSPLAPIKGHEAQLRAMLTHLIQNSLDALPPSGGTVRVVTTSDSRGWNVLEVRDTGAGMLAETIERAVEPFFSTKPGHLGVGLSIANGIWRRHRGTLSVQSVRGAGTCLRLLIEPVERGS